MKKALIVVLVALAGGGVAFGANVLLFKTTPETTPDQVPGGLGIESLNDAALATDAPSPSPTPTASPDDSSGGSKGGTTTQAAAPTATPSSGHRTPRLPSGAQDQTGGSSTNVESGVVTHPSTEQDDCSGENTEAARDRCEREQEQEQEQSPSP